METVPYEEHEKEVLEVIKERDYAQDMADSLAYALASVMGVDIGEHSSANCPWLKALEEFEDYKYESPTPTQQSIKE